MKSEKYINRSLEELAIAKRKIENQLVWILSGACLGISTLGVLSHNNFELLVGGTVISYTSFFLKFKEIISLIFNADYYYCHSKEYNEAYGSYQIFLDEFKRMVETLNWDNEMKVFSGYSYLFKQGYLSLSHEFYYSKYINNVWNYLGSNIILGEGNCKHINSMLRDILCNLGYSSYCFGMNLDKEIIRLNNMETKDIEDTTEEMGDLLQSYRFIDYLKSFVCLTLDVIDKIMKNNTNHLVTFVDKKNSSYFMDALNDALFFLDKKGHLFQGESEFNIDSTKLSGRHLNYGEVLNFKRLFKETDMEEMNVLLKDYYSVWNSCPDYRDTFEKFYQEHKELYEEVLVKRKELKKVCGRCSIF